MNLFREILGISRKRVFDLEDKSAFLSFRLILLMLLLFFMLSGQRGDLRWDQISSELLVWVLILSSVQLATDIAFALLPAKALKKGLRAGLILFDLILVSLALYGSRGSESLLFLIYFLVAFMTVAAGKPSLSFWVATLACFLYSFHFLKTHVFMDLFQPFAMSHFSLLFVTALLSSTLGRGREKEVGKMAPSDKAESKIRILVVDDEKDILTYLGKCFYKHGYFVQATDSPGKALELLQEKHFDLVLSDLRMAEMDGLTLLKSVKESHPATEVILMTGYASVETAVRSMRLGAFDYICKPFNVNEILTVLNRAIERLSAANGMARFQDWDKMRDDFLRNTSHELRTPLSSIQSASRMLSGDFHAKGNCLQGETPTKMLAIINRNAIRMIRLLDDLLDTFRFDSGKVTLNKVPFSIKGMIAECLEEFSSPCQERGLLLSSEVEEDLPMVEADPVKLRQALQNLLGNAMKFTFSGGKIAIGARRNWTQQLPTIEIFVRDSGIGIPLTEQKKIFEKFYQVEGSFGHGRQGLGLGLALTKAISEAHQGSISVQSVPGKGSSFCITIPITKAQSLRASGAENAEEDAVLVCDAQRRNYAHTQ